MKIKNSIANSRYKTIIEVAIICGVITLVTSGITEAKNYISTYENDENDYESETHEDVSLESSNEDHYLTHDTDPQKISFAMGELYIYEEVPVYSEYDGALLEYVAAAGTNWAVQEIVGDWYRIQHNHWLYLPNSDMYEYTSSNFVQGQTTMQVLATVYTGRGNYYVHQSPSKESETRSLEIDTSYDIYAITEKGWLKLGENAWLLFEDWMEIDQFEMNNRLQQEGTPIRTESTTTTMVPVFEGPDRKKPVIGLLEEVQDMYIYETVNADWVKVGQDAWIEADKYFSIDWAYRDFNNMDNPIGEARILAGTLNVRQGTSKETSLLGILQSNDVVEVYEMDPQTGWYLVAPGAYISNDAKYVEFTDYSTIQDDEYYSEEETTGVIGYIETYSSSIRVYSEPDEAYETKYMLNNDDVIDVYEEYNTDYDTWYRISEGGWIKYNESDITYYQY